MTDVTDIAQMLSSIPGAPPTDLAERTVFSAGAADRAAIADSPLGDVWVAWSTSGVTAVVPRFEADDFDAFSDIHRRRAFESDHLPSDLERPVIAALEGDTVGAPIDLAGLGTFQRAVLTACATIPRGVVHSYGWIAEQIRNPGSVRAVGTALATNPVPLIIPCHRIVRSDGSTGNYAFGAERKHALLVREGALLA